MAQTPVNGASGPAGAACKPAARMRKDRPTHPNRFLTTDTIDFMEQSSDPDTQLFFRRWFCRETSSWLRPPIVHYGMIDPSVLKTTLPPTMVSNGEISLIWSSGTFKKSAESTTRSANFPGSSDPFTFSSNVE